MPNNKSLFWLLAAGFVFLGFALGRQPVKVQAAPAAGAAAAGSAQGGSSVPRFEPAGCMVTLPEDVQEGKDVLCGYLVVPEHYAHPDGPTLELAVVVIKSQSPDTAPDPVVLNQGGPGGGTIEYFFSLLMERPLETARDILLFDQRGTGLSRPALDCPEINTAVYAQLDENLDILAFNQVYNAAALQCQQRLTREGVNLSAFNSLENANDIDALRQVLGYEKINLYGVSYGSLLALHTLREHPDGLRSVILDGVLPPQMNLNADVPFSADYGFTRFFEACAADASCSRYYPELETTFFNLVERLNQQPASLRLVDMQTGQAYTDIFTGDDLLWGVFQILYARELVPLLPELIRSVDLGRYGPLEAIQSVLVFDRSVMMGMYWSVYCAEDGDFDPQKLDFSTVRPEIAKDQLASMRGTWELCQNWGVPDLGSRADAPPLSDIPALVMSGQFDPITPAPNGQLAAQSLSHSTLVTFPGNGHGALYSSECANRIFVDFLDNPQAKLDLSCVDQLPPVDFLTPVDYAPVPLGSLLLDSIALQPGALILLGTLLASWAALLSAPFIYTLHWLVRKLRRPPGEPLPARLAWAAWLTVLMSGFSTLLLGWMVWHLARSLINNELLVLFGFPISAALLLPPILGVFALLAAAAIVSSLLVERTYTLLRLYQLLISMAGVAFAVGLAAAGLMTAGAAWLWNS